MEQEGTSQYLGHQPTDHPAHPRGASGLRPGPRPVVHEREHDAGRHPRRAVRGSAVAEGDRRRRRRGVLRRPGRGVLPAERDRPGRRCPGYGTVCATDVVAKVENQIYLTAPEPGGAGGLPERRRQGGLQRVRRRARRPGHGDPGCSCAAVTEGRIRMHSFVDSEQDDIADTEIAGELETADDERPGRDLRQRRARVEDELLPDLRRRRDHPLLLRLRPGGRGVDPADQHGAARGGRAADRLGDLPRRSVLQGDRARSAAASRST